MVRKAIALPLAVLMLLNAVPVVSYAVEDGGADPDILPVTDTGIPARGMRTTALTGEETIDTSTWDPNFVAALKEGYPELFDGENLVKSKVEAVTSLDVMDKAIQSLEGIEYFTALEWFDCSSNNLTTLDLSQNTLLKYLNCYKNNLTTLYISHNMSLEWIECWSNNLTTLDLSQNTLLKYLHCTKNNLTSLDLSHNMALEGIECGYNNLTALDLSHNTKLEWIECYYNNLNSLDLSNNIKLDMIRCNSNNLTDLDLSHNTVLSVLECGDNNLTALDLSKNTALTELWCDHNDLTSLDLSHNKALKTLGCNSNNLTILDLSHNTKLEWFDCSNNSLTILDLSQSMVLEWLICSNNNLTFLDLSQNAVLGFLECGGNSLTALDLSHNKQLTNINCNNNNLNSLDLSQNKELVYLICCDNNLTALDLSQNTKAEYCCGQNPIQHLIRPTGEELTISIEPSNGGSIMLMHDDHYPWQRPSVLIENPNYLATSAEGYTFTGWTGDVTSSEPKITFNLSSNMTVTANFAADENDNAGNHTNNNTVSNESHYSGTSASAAPSSDAPALPKGTLTTQQAAIKTRAAVQKAKQSGAARATVSLKNMETLTRQAAQAIVKEAGGFPVRVQADSTLNNGKIVARLSFDPAQIIDTIQLAAFTDSAKTKSVRTLFNKYFENNIQVVRLEQKGDFGMPVNLAVKLDAKLQGKTLYFYRYNQAGNAYTRIASPKYRIDANGYVHFTTKFAGYIVISDGSLTEK